MAISHQHIRDAAHDLSDEAHGIEDAYCGYEPLRFPHVLSDGK